MKHALILLAVIGIGIVTDSQTFAQPDGIITNLKPIYCYDPFPSYLQNNGYQHRYINEPYKVVTPEEAGYTQEELNEIYYE